MFPPIIKLYQASQCVIIVPCKDGTHEICGTTKEETLMKIPMIWSQNRLHLHIVYIYTGIFRHIQTASGVCFRIILIASGTLRTEGALSTCEHILTEYLLSPSVHTHRTQRPAPLQGGRWSLTRSLSKTTKGGAGREVPARQSSLALKRIFFKEKAYVSMDIMGMFYCVQISGMASLSQLIMGATSKILSGSRRSIRSNWCIIGPSNFENHLSLRLTLGMESNNSSKPWLFSNNQHPDNAKC